MEGWIVGRVTRVEGGDPCAWDDIDWLANLINRLVGYWVDLVFISLSIVFQDLEILTKHSAWTRHDNHILSHWYTFDHVSTVRGRANDVWHSFYCYQNRSEVCLLNNGPPKNEKDKVSFCTVSLMIALLLLASTRSLFM